MRVLLGKCRATPERSAYNARCTQPMRFENDPHMTIPARGWRMEKTNWCHLPIRDDIASVAFGSQTWPPRRCWMRTTSS